MSLYILKFEPILKDRIWGGTKLKTLLGKGTTSNITGESWEISGVPGDISKVANGPLKGWGLDRLISTYGDALLGKQVLARFGTVFPILIKFIDAKQDLSIQVHPGDDLAKKRHNSFGKNEMWYIMQADTDARLIVGFSKTVTKDEYLHYLENKTLMDILNADVVHSGDTFYIPTGTVHAIGAGILLAEIQQTSDITYRIYDFDRKDQNGNPRQLHTQEALDAIDYNKKNEAKTHYETTKNITNAMIESLYFTTNYLNLTTNFKPDLNARESFTIFMCVQGEGSVYDGSYRVSFRMGETLLVANCLKNITIETQNATLLEVHL